MTPKCHRCAGDHCYSECKKPTNTTPKCANCEVAHPADYSLCPTHLNTMTMINTHSKTNTLFSKDLQPKTTLSKENDIATRNQITTQCYPMNHRAAATTTARITKHMQLTSNYEINRHQQENSSRHNPLWQHFL